MSTKACAAALEWWLREQNKFEGAKVSTRQCNYDPKNLGATPLFEITKWEVDGVVKPTDAQINQIIIDYGASLVVSEQEKKDKKIAIKNKLGLSDSDMEDLKEAIKG